MAITKDVQDRIIMDPNNWPGWPMLPVKKLGGYGLGVVLETEGPEILIVEGNMFAGIKGDAPRHTFQSLDEVWDAGWRVD
jgi:hypothetical protein